jgi:hypothetical protein
MRRRLRDAPSGAIELIRGRRLRRTAIEASATPA